MERFSGSLAHYRVALVMPALLEGVHPQGTLRLERAGVQREFRFKDRKLIADRSNQPSEHLAQVLVKLKLLSAPEAAEAFAAADAASKPLGALLVERGRLSRNDLVQALEHKAREALLDCYLWESGEMELDPHLPDTTAGVDLELDLDTLHAEGVARARAVKELPASERDAADADLSELLDLARNCLQDGDFHRAVAALARALEQGPLPEGQALYRQAELQLASAIGEKISSLEGKLIFHPLAGPVPDHLTADDLYLYTRLRSTAHLATALKEAAMGELSAYHAFQRLISSGLVEIDRPDGHAPPTRGLTTTG